MARYLETIDVCIWCMFVFMSVVVIVWGSGNVCCVAGIVKDKCFCLGVLLYDYVRGVVDVVFFFVL